MRASLEKCILKPLHRRFVKWQKIGQYYAFWRYWGWHSSHCRVFAAVDSETAIGVWLFDDGDVSDSSSYGNDGELMNGAEVTDGGKWGKALSLDGDDDYVNVANSESLDSTAEAFTGVAWIKNPTKRAIRTGACCADDHMVIAFTTNWNNILNVFGPGRSGKPRKSRSR